MFDDKTDSAIEIDKTEANNYLNEHFKQFVADIFSCTIADELARGRDFDYSTKVDLAKKISPLLVGNCRSIFNGLILAYKENACSKGITTDSIFAEYNRLLASEDYRKAAKRTIASFGKISRVYQDSTICFCVSENKDNPDMWIRYADEGRGFCVEYSKPGYKNGDLWYESLFPVIYGNREKINPLDFIGPSLLSRNCELSESFQTDDRLLTYLSLLTKDVAWANQEEWRFIDHLNDLGQTGKSISFPYVTRVFAGHNIKQDDYHKLENACHSLQIPLIKN